MFKLLSSFLLLVVILSVANSARILGVFPVPSISHQFVFRALTMELAKRGHELVVITTDPAFPNSQPPYNITEIDISFSYQHLYNMSLSFGYKRGVFMEPEAMADYAMYKDLIDLIEIQTEHPDIVKLIQDKNQKFDLILVESIMNYQLIFSHIFKAPVILIATFHGYPENFETVGAVGRHPIYYPCMIRKNLGDLNIFEKIQELYLEYKFIVKAQKIEAYETEKLKNKYGANTPTIRELYNNIQVFFVNSNEIFNNNRPVTPNTVYVGPLHLQPTKDLPQDLKTYLDSSTRGVIYVSLGTNVRPTLMDPDLLDAFLDAFEALPYDILWKFDGDSLKRTPKNLKIQKWFPQRDLLPHPNIKLFVTQGGLQSSDEAIDAGVPLVVIPMLADQFYNAHKFEELGIGVKLDTLSLNAKLLLEGINKVLADNHRYRKNVRNLRNILNDHPQTPMERAIWWTEYVLRHGGAKHFRSPASNTTWSEYLMLDVVLVLVSLALALVLTVLVAAYYILRLFRKTKLKQT